MSIEYSSIQQQYCQPQTIVGEIMSLEDAFHLATIAIAIAATFSTGFFAMWNLRLSRASARQEYFDEIRKWGDQASDVVTEAIHLCDLDPRKVDGETFFDRRHRLRISLSSLANRGRWFFPNTDVEKRGIHKEIGYRGYRHEVLDGLLAAYVALELMDDETHENNTDVREGLTRAKRHFVGQLQKVLAPGRQIREFNRIMAISRSIA
jgi:hypothetical protein